MALEVRARGDEVLFEVVLAPRASRDAVGGEHDRALKVAVTAPPVGGAANAALCALVARALGVPKGAVRVVRGGSARRKTLAVAGVRVEDLEALAAGGLSPSRGRARPSSRPRRSTS